MQPNESIEPVEKVNYKDYLVKLDGINYKKDEKIKKFIEEIKQHQLKRIEYFESLQRNYNSDMRMEAIQSYK